MSDCSPFHGEHFQCTWVSFISLNYTNSMTCHLANHFWISWKQLDKRNLLLGFFCDKYPVSHVVFCRWFQGIVGIVLTFIMHKLNKNRLCTTHASKSIFSNLPSLGCVQLVHVLKFIGFGLYRILLLKERKIYQRLLRGQSGQLYWTRDYI